MINKLTEILEDTFKFADDRRRPEFVLVDKNFDSLVKKLEKIARYVEDHEIKKKISKKEYEFIINLGDDPDSDARKIYKAIGLNPPLKKADMPSYINPEYWNCSEGELITLLEKELPNAIKGPTVSRSGVEVSTSLYMIKDKNKPVFCAHLDTMGGEGDYRHNHVEAFTDGDKKLLVRPARGMTSILGADDRAGVQIIMNMIKAGKDVNYIFTTGEEVGLVGSRKLIRDKNFMDAAKDCFIVVLDRRGEEDILTKRGKYCKEDLRDAVIEATKDEAGKATLIEADAIHSDADAFSEAGIPCVNVSVGYRREHSHLENLVLEWFEKAQKRAFLMEDKLRGEFKSPRENESQTFSFGSETKGVSKVREVLEIIEDLSEDQIDLLFEKVRVMSSSLRPKRTHAMTLQRYVELRESPAGQDPNGLRKFYPNFEKAYQNILSAGDTEKGSEAGNILKK